MIWCGIVKWISKKWNIQAICHDQSSRAQGFTRGLNQESGFVSIENISQKHIKVCLVEKKLSSLKDTDFKYRLKNESIHGIITDD